MIDPYCGEDLWCAGGVLVSRYSMTLTDAMETFGSVGPAIYGTAVSIVKAEPDFTKEGELELTLRLQLDGRVVPYSLNPSDTGILMERAGVVYVDELEGGVIDADVFKGSIDGLFYENFRME